MANRVITPDLTDLSSLGVVSGDTLLAFGGVQSIVAGTNFSTINRLTNVYFGPNAAINFVSLLRLGTSGSLDIQMNSGSVKFQAACTGTGANTIAEMNVQGACTVMDVGGGEVTVLNQTLGSVSIAEGTDLVTFRHWGGSAEVGYDSTAITTFEARGASSIIRRPVTTATVSNRANVMFSREVVTESSGLTATTLNIDNATVTWIGGAITTVNLLTPGSVFNWRLMNESVTIGTVAGHAAAIARSGLRQGGVNTTSSGKTVTVSTLTVTGGKLSDYGGGGPV